jgi:hypothetical protein
MIATGGQKVAVPSQTFRLFLGYDSASKFPLGPPSHVLDNENVQIHKKVAILIVQGVIPR